MPGSGSGPVSVARSRRGENRFYWAPPLRKKQVDSTGSILGAHSEKNNVPVLESDESVSNCSVYGRTENTSVSSNLDRFLGSTTPRVPIQYLPKVIGKFFR